MANETNEAPSQPPAQADNSDGKKAANVSADQLERLFQRAEEKRSASPAADTKATSTTPQASPASEQPPAQGQTQESSSAAEPANAGSQEAAATDGEKSEAQAAEDSKEEGEGDQVLSPETSSTLDAATQEAIDKRIGKEVAKRKAQEARTQQLETELSQLKEHVSQLAQVQPQANAQASLPAPTKAPLPDIKNPADLSEYKTLAKQTIRMAEAVLDREDIDWGQGEVVIPEFGEKPVTKTQIKTILRNARIAWEDTIPEQEQYFQHQQKQEQQRVQIRTAAVTKFPFLVEKDNQDVVQTLAFFQQNAPEFLQNPAAAWVIGAYIKGIKATQAEEAAAKDKGTGKPAAKPAVTRPKPPGDQTTVSTTGTVQRLNPDAMGQNAAATERQKLFAQHGATSDATAKFLERMDQMRQRR